MKTKLTILLLCLLAYSALNAQIKEPADSARKKVDSATIDPLKDFRSFNTLRGLISDSLFVLKEFPVARIPMLYKRPLAINTASVDYSGSTHDSYFGSGIEYMGALNINTDWSLIGIPLSATLAQDQWTTLNRPIISDFKTAFSREKYLATLRKQLNSKVDFAKYIAALENPLASAKKAAAAAFHEELQGVNVKYQNLLQGRIKELGNIDSLLVTDIRTVKQRLLTTDFMQSLAASENRFEQLQNKINSRLFVDSAEYTQAKNALQEAKGLQEIVSAIEKHKKQWEKSGLISKLKELDLLKKERLHELLKDPATISRLAKQHLSMNGLQRAFLKINKLNLGQNVGSSSPLAMNHFLNNGAGVEFLDKGKYLSALIGKNGQNTSLLDMPFTNTPATITQARALSFGKGVAGKGVEHSRISVMGFNQSMNPAAQGFQVLSPYRQSLTTTLTKSFAVGSLGTVLTELSRSVSNYNSGSAAGENKILQRLLSSDDFLNNTAFAVRYNDDLPDFDLNYGLRLGKVFNGYNNPGSPFLNNGSMEAGINLRKNLWKKKVQLTMRTDLKEYKYNDRLDNKWRNCYTVLDLRWRLKKGQALSIRYLPNRMYRVSDSDKEKVTHFDQFSLDAQLSKKIGRKYYTVYSSLANQKNSYTVTNQKLGNSSWIMILNQTMAIGNKTVYWNTNLNQSQNSLGLVYFNSQLNSETGLSYGVLKKLQASTTVSYNSVAQWYKQAGLRQSLSCRIDERFDGTVFVDVRRNIELHQPLLFGLTRGQATLRYSFNHK